VALSRRLAADAALRRRLGWALLALCVLGFVAHAAVYWGWLEDDAFISLRYARNLAQGRGLVFNPGERVEGFSNPLWVLLAAAAFRVHLDPLLVWRLLGIACGALSVLLSWRLARGLLAEAGGWALLAPVYLAASPVLAKNAVSGLETTLFAALLAGSLLAARHLQARRGPWLLAGLLALLSWTRPEGPLFALLIVLTLLRRRGAASGERGSALPLSRGPLLLLLGAWALGLAARWTAYGDLLPNTFYAKMSADRGAVVEGLRYSLGFLRDSGGILLIPLISAAVLTCRSASCRRLSLVTGTYALFVVLAGGDWMQHYRLYAHVLPLLAGLMAAGGGRIARKFSLAGQTAAAGTRIALLLLCVLGFASMARAERTIARRLLPAVRTGGYLVQKYEEVGLWLKARSEPGDRVAISDIGAAGYYSGLRILDMFGLVDPHLARQEGRLHLKADPQRILAQKPRFVVLVESRTEPGRFHRVPDAALYAQPLFRERYAPVHRIPLTLQNAVITIYERTSRG
jgi:arabinofuranosyltransferase